MNLPIFEDVSKRTWPKLKAHRRQQMGPKISRWSAFMWKYNSNDALRDMVDLCIGLFLLFLTMTAICVVSLLFNEPINP
jgi:hypothetical protein